jgi:hypothetical protein
MTTPLRIVAYGGGTNSTAMLILLRDQGIAPDLILFADTGGERPETYAHVERMNQWCSVNGFPEIVTVRKAGRLYRGETLEQNCRRKNMLPSVAYGHKKCALKYKRQPQDMFCNRWAPARAAWKRGEKVVKFVGFDADEPTRVKETEDGKYLYCHPLIEADWGRDECVAAIRREGLPLPGKSSCFYCPNSKKWEIKSLAKKHPDLMARALEMEANAELKKVKGLGRRFSWAEFLAADERVQDMFQDYGDMPCGCYDGDDEPCEVDQE